MQAIFRSPSDHLLRRTWNRENATVPGKMTSQVFAHDHARDIGISVQVPSYHFGAYAALGLNPLAIDAKVPAWIIRAVRKCHMGAELPEECGSDSFEDTTLQTTDIAEMARERFMLDMA
jgi:hypothetical protein